MVNNAYRKITNIKVIKQKEVHSLVIVSFTNAVNL